jgi:kynurenine formamidase
MTINIRGTNFEENLDNGMGLKFYDLSHPWGLGQPCWPYFQDVQIDRLHTMARSGVLTSRITTSMHSGTHMDAPAHVVEETPFMDEIPLPYFFGTGVVVSIPKEKWGVITAEDLEKASPAIQPGDIVVVNTGWHKYYGDNSMYYGYSPGFYKEAGEWFAKKKVKLVCTDTQALDHPLATAMGPHGPARPNGLLPHVCAEYKRETGHDVLQDFPEWEPCHRAILSAGICGIENVGGDIDLVTGKRCTFIATPLRWTKGDGSMVRLVAMVDPTAQYRIETGGN